MGGHSLSPSRTAQSGECDLEVPGLPLGLGRFLGGGWGGRDCLSHEAVPFLSTPPLILHIGSSLCLEMHTWKVPLGFLIQKLLTSPWMRSVTLWSSPSTLNTSGLPGTTTGGSRGRVTLRDEQEIRHGMRRKQRQEAGETERN